MESLADFRDSLSFNRPPGEFPAQLKSLWYDKKGDWNAAHAQVDQLTDEASAWVHAYLHRKEGDIWNADYWYRKAGKMRPATSLDEEWEQLTLHFLN